MMCRIHERTIRPEPVEGRTDKRANAAWALILAALLTVDGCAHRASLPHLALTPRSFGGQLAQTQRLTFSALRAPLQPNKKPHSASIDALVEITPESVQLVGFMLNQQILKLCWDGINLTSEQSEKLPPTVTAAQVLRDVQLVFWPDAAIQAALPVGWQIQTGPDIQTSMPQRELQQNGQLRVRIRYHTDAQRNGTIEFENLAEGYRLHIEAVTESEAQP